MSAKKLFAERGFSGTPVRAINREIGMADGLLYHYFQGGKKELLEVLINEGFEETIGNIGGFIDDCENLPIEEILDQIFRMGDEMISENLDLLKILLREIDDIEPERIRCLAELLEVRRKWVAGILKRRCEKGEIREMDFDAATEQLLAVGINNLLSKITGLDIGHMNTPEKRERNIRHILDTWRPLQAL